MWVKADGYSRADEGTEGKDDCRYNGKRKEHGLKSSILYSKEYFSGIK
jgi:hypothetical protein